MEYAEKVMADLIRKGVRVEIYSDSEPMKVKIAKAQSQKVPYMLVVGDREADAESVAVRYRQGGDQGKKRLAFYKQVQLAIDREAKP